MTTSILSLLNGIQARHTSHILLYHATMRNVPNNLKSNLHNVDPNVLYHQLNWLTKYFDVVNLEEYCRLDDTTGKAVITFDDAYSSIISEGLPVLKSLNIPCTVFICGCTLEGKVFWRDKIRFIISNDLESEFRKYCHITTGTEVIPDTKNFYRYTKTAAVNSKKLNVLIDAFFEEASIVTDELTYCVSDEKDLLRSPLVSYGNHTYDHYLLSSLSKDEQEEQIVKNKELIDRIIGKHSCVFSIPFGGAQSFNSSTCRILRRHGYHYLLFSRGRVNMQGKSHNGAQYPSFERYMPVGRYSSFQNQLAKMWLKEFLH